MAAAFMVSPPPHGPPLELRVQNGTSPNAVEIAIDGSDETITLEPSEARQIPLRSPSAENSVHVRVRSPSGFRPSDAGLSEDRRFLGVWIAIDTREEPPLP
jgi:hypothetical protein